MIKKYSYLFLILLLIIGPLYPKFSFIAIICMISPIISSFFLGRYYCYNICPRAGFYDQKISKICRKKPTPKILKSKIFRLICLVFMFIVFAFGIKNNLKDIDDMALVFYKMVLITTIIGIALSQIYNHRTWCAFCPMGSLADFISHIANKMKKRQKNRKL